jgi:hypothetical protein
MTYTKEALSISTAQLIDEPSDTLDYPLIKSKHNVKVKVADDPGGG